MKVREVMADLIIGGEEIADMLILMGFECNGLFSTVKFRIARYSGRNPGGGCLDSKCGSGLDGDDIV